MEIQKQWLVRLVEITEELKKLDKVKKQPITTYAKLQYLFGYIDSIKDLLK